MPQNTSEQTLEEQNEIYEKAFQKRELELRQGLRKTDYYTRGLELKEIFDDILPNVGFSASKQAIGIIPEDIISNMFDLEDEPDSLESIPYRLEVLQDLASHIAPSKSDPIMVECAENLQKEIHAIKTKFKRGNLIYSEELEKEIYEPLDDPASIIPDIISLEEHYKSIDKIIQVKRNEAKIKQVMLTLDLMDDKICDKINRAMEIADAFNNDELGKNVSLSGIFFHKKIQELQEKSKSIDPSNTFAVEELVKDMNELSQSAEYLRYLATCQKLGDILLARAKKNLGALGNKLQQTQEEVEKLFGTENKAEKEVLKTYLENKKKEIKMKMDEITTSKDANLFSYSTKLFKDIELMNKDYHEKFIPSIELKKILIDLIRKNKEYINNHQHDASRKKQKNDTKKNDKGRSNGISWMSNQFGKQEVATNLDKELNNLLMQNIYNPDDLLAIMEKHKELHEKNQGILDITSKRPAFFKEAIEEIQKCKLMIERVKQPEHNPLKPEVQKLHKMMAQVQQQPEDNPAKPKKKFFGH